MQDPCLIVFGQLDNVPFDLTLKSAHERLPAALSAHGPHELLKIVVRQLNFHDRLDYLVSILTRRSTLERASGANCHRFSSSRTLSTLMAQLA